MRKGIVYNNHVPAGELIEQTPSNYTFRYNDTYFSDIEKKSICLTLPKTQKEYHASFLFPFFFNMLSEGVNRKLQCQQWRIDENDHFGLLLATAGTDTIGAITVKPDINIL
jgi:HipA-like protein